VGFSTFFFHFGIHGLFYYNDGWMDGWMNMGGFLNIFFLFGIHDLL
jgi:hypothetical protein